LASQVRLVVFDLLGRDVRILVNDRQGAGFYEVRFDGPGLPSGVYFYRLEAGENVSVKRLMLVR
jgi:hypothetical protein